jgi:hypothetical protein
MKTIFISNSHKDRRLLEELTDFLKPLERANQVSLWIDHAKIKSGDIWKQEITQALAEAELALLLVTQRFIASDFIHRNELSQLLERARTAGVKILWIALSKSTVNDTEINNTDWGCGAPPVDFRAGQESIPKSGCFYLSRLTGTASDTMSARDKEHSLCCGWCRL